MAINGLPGTIGLVTSSLDTDYARRLVSGATENLIANDFTPLCFAPGASGPDERQIPLAYLEFVDPHLLSGIILSLPSILNVDLASGRGNPDGVTCAEAPRYDTKTFLRRMGDLPVVYIGAWTSGVPSLWVQNGAGIRLLMQHLTEVCGRHRIAFVRGPDHNVEAEARFRAWQDFCVEHSLPQDDELVALGDFTMPTGEAAALKILEMNDRQLPDAFVVANDRMACGVLRALQTKGLSVPGDVSVVGFDDLEAESANPPLTTIRQPVFEMGYRAAEALIALIRKESVPQEHMFSPELIVRASSNPHQPASTNDPACTGIGASVFLDSAYPSAELLLPLLRKLGQDAQQHLRSPDAHGSHLAVELECGLRRTKTRERDLVNGGRRMRARAVEHLDQELSHANSLQELHAFVLAHIRCIGVVGLTVAMLCNRAGSMGEARLVVACNDADEAPVGPLGARLFGAQIIAAHAQRTKGNLCVAEPLYHEGEYCGFLVASGMLIDNPLLFHLGAVLTRAAMRIAK